MNSTRKLNNTRGFTLIELMITVAVVAVLAAIAYPSYRDSVLKARRGEGRSAINSTMQMEERYYSANNAYYLFNSGTSPLVPGFSTASSSSTNSAYTIRADGSTTDCNGTTALNQCVIVTATSTQTDPLCGTMTMNSAGKKLPAACW